MDRFDQLQQFSLFERAQYIGAFEERHVGKVLETDTSKLEAEGIEAYRMILE